MSIQNFDEKERHFTIAEHLDPDGDMPAYADPVAEYLTYLAHVRGSAVGDMGFTLEDFKRYIAGLQRPGKTRGLRRLRIACLFHSWIPTRERRAPVLIQNFCPHLK